MSLPNFFDPETLSVNCMPLGKCRKKMLVILILENFVCECEALWRTKHLSVVSPPSGDKGKFQRVTSARLFHCVLCTNSSASDLI